MKQIVCSMQFKLKEKHHGHALFYPYLGRQL